MTANADLSEDATVAASPWTSRWTTSFRYRPYRHYFAGSVLTQITMQMQLLVLGWQVLEATGSAFWVGIVAFAYGLPLLVLSPFTGVLADRFKRQRMVAFSLALTAFSLSLLAVGTATNREAPLLFLAASFLTGSAFSLYAPARQALLPTLIPFAVLPTAATLEYSSTRLAGFIGPVVAGVMVETIGTWQTLVALVGLCIIGILLFRGTGPEQEPHASAEGARDMLHELQEALSYLRQDRPLLALSLLAMVTVPIGLVYQKLLPVYARDVLDAGASTLGLLAGTSSLGIGLAGFGIIAINERIPKGVAVLYSSLFLGVALALFATSRQLGVALALIFIVGLLSGVFMTLTNVLYQSRVPDTLRGRILAMYAMVWGLLPFAALGAGALAERWHITGVLATSGAICSAVCLLALFGGTRLKEL